MSVSATVARPGQIDGKTPGTPPGPWSGVTCPTSFVAERTLQTPRSCEGRAVRHPGAGTGVDTGGAEAAPATLTLPSASTPHTFSRPRSNGVFPPQNTSRKYQPRNVSPVLTPPALCANSAPTPPPPVRQHFGMRLHTVRAAHLTCGASCALHSSALHALHTVRRRTPHIWWCVHMQTPLKGAFSRLALVVPLCVNKLHNSRPLPLIIAVYKVQPPHMLPTQVFF